MPRAAYLKFSPPFIGEEEIAEVVDTLRTEWITTGPKTKRFEGEFAEYVGAEAALALNSCTAGLHTALTALGIGPGDEVITTPMTFASTVNVIEHVGARPVLADVLPDVLTLDPARTAAVVTAHTKALLPVHFAGHPAEMDPLTALAETHGLAIVEDAAHALPAQYKGRTIGAGHNLTAFSFYATKNMTTSEGGMLTGPAALIDEARVISLHGMSRDAWKRYDTGGNWFYEVVCPGYKYNMTDIQASLGLWQLRKLARFQERRHEVVAAYQAAFAGCDALETPSEHPEAASAWHLYTLRLRPEMLRIERDQFIRELHARNIGTSVHFIPIHLHPYYREKYGFQPEDFPVAYANYLRMVSLPLNPHLDDADVADVIEAVLEIVEANRA